MVVTKESRSVWIVLSRRTLTKISNHRPNKQGREKKNKSGLFTEQFRLRFTQVIYS